LDREQCLLSYGSRAGEPAVELAPQRMSLQRAYVKPTMATSLHMEVRLGQLSLSPTL
jgi:hypothetical protein